MLIRNECQITAAAYKYRQMQFQDQGWPGFFLEMATPIRLDARNIDYLLPFLLKATNVHPNGA